MTIRSRKDPVVDVCKIPYEVLELARANQLAFTPTKSMPLTVLDQNGITPTEEYLDEYINLYVVCCSPGIVAYQLIRDGGAEWTIQPVIAGERIHGHFRRIGPGTTVYPLIGFGNL